VHAAAADASALEEAFEGGLEGVLAATLVVHRDRICRGELP
jgi:hypothetical protein